MGCRSTVQGPGPVLGRCAGTLRAIARAGVGVDNIDVETATRLGIAVMNAASASTITTAEHAFALMISLARNIPWAHAAMAGSGWDRGKFVGTELHGKTLGIVGLGRIGLTLARRAFAFGMQGFAYDPFIHADSMLDGTIPLRAAIAQLTARLDSLSLPPPTADRP